jgi:hypothetical protein
MFDVERINKNYVLGRNFSRVLYRLGLSKYGWFIGDMDYVDTLKLFAMKDYTYEGWNLGRD